MTERVMNTKEKKNKIPRPLNAFMLYANDNRSSFRNDHPGETNSRISVRLGEAWKQLNGKEKTKYYQLSKKAEIEHRNKYPDYTYCPNEARSKKKSRRQMKAGSDGNLQTKHLDGTQQSLLTDSSENCNTLAGSAHGIHGYGDWKADFPAGVKKELCQSGQGDQMRHFSMPYGPQYPTPFSYPRFPSWDFRGHPYMSGQYGRMPFFPHPVMYPCGPTSMPFVPTAQGQQQTDGNVNYLSQMSTFYPLSQAGKDQVKVEPFTSNCEQQTSTTLHAAHAGIQGSTVKQTLSSTQHHSVHTEQQEKLSNNTCGSDSGMAASEIPQQPPEGTGQFQVNMSTMRYQIPYGVRAPSHQQHYTYDPTQQQSLAFAPVRSNAPDSKSFADLSNGQVQIVNVIPS